jgi:hypothetical protein
VAGVKEGTSFWTAVDGAKSVAEVTAVSGSAAPQATKNIKNKNVNDVAILFIHFLLDKCSLLQSGKRRILPR